jgi:hypothetical protein
VPEGGVAGELNARPGDGDDWQAEADTGYEAAVVIVYLWDAATWSGVSGSQDQAQRHAAACLGEGGQGRIEAARLVLGFWTLTFCYQRTGPAWTTRRCPDGTVFWDPVSPGRVLEAS